MFGVVLWSDTQDQKAVIWCEDHGDLAFYKQDDGGRSVDLDAGDWVQFDLTNDRQLRLAHNPRLVSEAVYPEIAGTLSSSHPAPNPVAATPQPHRGSAEIIPFSVVRNAQQAVREGPALHSA